MKNSKKPILWLSFLCLFSSFSSHVWAIDDAEAKSELSLNDQANQYYQDQNWSASATSYQKIVDANPENQLAGYRLANSLIELRKVDEAAKMLEKIKDSSVLPASAIAYQFAQIAKLQGDTEKVWSLLNSAVDQGYSNEATFSEAPIWKDIRDQDQFSSLSKRVSKNAHPCVHDPRYAEFDFWLGSWSVYGNTEKTGPLYGNNTISKEQDGCLVSENWVGASGTTGTSMNYYDGTKEKWVQHWVSFGGVTINIEGGLDDDSMKLVGKIFYLNSQAPQIRDFRASWTPLENGVVRQFFEESVDQGKTWYTWFEGFYFPDEKPNTAKD